jgi:hypothetical protein
MALQQVDSKTYTIGTVIPALSGSLSGLTFLIPGIKDGIGDSYQSTPPSNVPLGRNIGVGVTATNTGTSQAYLRIIFQLQDSNGANVGTGITAPISGMTPVGPGGTYTTQAIWTPTAIGTYTCNIFLQMSTTATGSVTMVASVAPSIGTVVSFAPQGEITLPSSPYLNDNTGNYQSSPPTDIPLGKRLGIKVNIKNKDTTYYYYLSVGAVCAAAGYVSPAFTTSTPVAPGESVEAGPFIFTPTVAGSYTMIITMAMGFTVSGMVAADTVSMGIGDTEGSAGLGGVPWGWIAAGVAVLAVGAVIAKGSKGSSKQSIRSYSRR